MIPVEKVISRGGGDRQGEEGRRTETSSGGEGPTTLYSRRRAWGRALEHRWLAAGTQRPMAGTQWEAGGLGRVRAPNRWQRPVGSLHWHGSRGCRPGCGGRHGCGAAAAAGRACVRSCGGGAACACVREEPSGRVRECVCVGVFGGGGWRVRVRTSLFFYLFY